MFSFKTQKIFLIKVVYHLVTANIYPGGDDYFEIHSEKKNYY